MGQKIAEDKDWEPDKDIKRAWCELQEAQLWLATQEKCPTPSVPEMPLKKPGERQPAPKSPTGKQAAGGGQEGSTRCTFDSNSYTE